MEQHPFEVDRFFFNLSAFFGLQGNSLKILFWFLTKNASEILPVWSSYILSVLNYSVFLVL